MADAPLSTVCPPGPGSFRWALLPVWLACCAGLGLLVGWAAVVARAYAAPLLLFPLVVGSVLGGLIVLAMRVLNLGHRPTIWLGALLAGLLAVAGQHYFTFLRIQRQHASQPDRLVKLRLVAPERIPPSDFVPFLLWSADRGLPLGGYRAQGLWVWLLWTVDGLLITLTTLLLAAITARMPYCDRCGRWYRVIRSGKWPPSLAEKWPPLLETIRRDAAAAADSSTPLAAFHRYRMIACEGGCGPTGLILSGEDSRGRAASQVVWLDAAGRAQLATFLDQVTWLSPEMQVPHGKP
jgi:hypothetical protein